MRRLTFDRRRAELIQAAIRVIARDGLSAATTRAIVAEADMPLGAFHYCFASRDELITAVIDQVTDDERIAAWLEADAVSDGAELEAILEQGLSAYIGLLEADPAREQVLLEVAVHAIRHDTDAVERQWARYREVTVASLERAAELASVTWTEPVEDVARALLSALDGLTITWFTDRDTEGARRQAAFLARSIAALAAPRAG